MVHLAPTRFGRSLWSSLVGETITGEQVAQRSGDPIVTVLR